MEKLGHYGKKFQYAILPRGHTLIYRKVASKRQFFMFIHDSSGLYFVRNKL